MWFFPERIQLEKKRHQKKNTRLWFPFTYLGYSCATSTGSSAADRKRQEMKPVWETESCKFLELSPGVSDSFQWKEGHTHANTIKLSESDDWHPLPLYHFDSSRFDHRGPWKRLMGPDSCSLQTVDRVEKLPSSGAWNMCLSVAFLMQPLVSLALAGGRWGRLLVEERPISLNPRNLNKPKPNFNHSCGRIQVHSVKSSAAIMKSGPVPQRHHRHKNTTQQRPSVFKYAVRTGCKLFKPSTSCTYDYFASCDVHNNGGQHERKGDEMAQEKEDDDTQFTIKAVLHLVQCSETRNKTLDGGIDNQLNKQNW